eukprot:854744-Amphidinium_carterae.1
MVFARCVPSIIEPSLDGLNIKAAGHVRDCPKHKKEHMQDFQTLSHLTCGPNGVPPYKQVAVNLWQVATDKNSLKICFANSRVGARPHSAIC